jgi:hypothetical protein
MTSSSAGFNGSFNPSSSCYIEIFKNILFKWAESNFIHGIDGEKTNPMRFPRLPRGD